MFLIPSIKSAKLKRLITVACAFTLLSQIVFIGSVRKANAKVKPPVADTSSPAEPFIVNSAPTFSGTFISGVSSLLGFVAPTTAKKESPKTVEAAIEPPSPATAQPAPFMSSATAAEFAALRLLPGNATGGTDLYSRNFGWGTSLVGLPGRAGMDAGFGISYNSLVWIKDTTNSEIIFDPDLSNVSPGFQMGLPEIEKIYNTGGDNYSFLMVNPDGSRTEFRRVGTTTTFEPGDSSYRQLVISSGGVTSKAANIELTVTSTDGTMMHYLWKSHVSKYECEEIKDRNGNIISIGYTSGRLTSMEDTLGRVVTISRDGGGYPTTIEQTWKDSNGSGSNVTHTWATFSYTNATVSTSFSGLTVIGPANSTTVKALEKITYPDSSFTKFEYNGYLQVKKISQVAADSTSHILNYVTTDLASVSGSQTDCPRFGETKTWVENFNGGSEVVVTNALTTGATYSLPNSITGSATRIDVAMTGHPDGLYSRTYVGASGYKEGLTLATEDCTGSNCATRLRWTWTDWTQDNTGVSYITNPRVVESRVGDGTNIKKTTVGYGSNGYGLPEEVKVYDTDLSTVLKTQTTAYSSDSAYITRRIIGLPTETKLWQGTTSGTLMSKVTYAYDEGNLTGTDPVQNISPVQHDNTNYSSSFVTGRGLVTTVKRWDATDPTDSNDAVTTTMKYNTAGAVVSKTTPWYSTYTRTVKIAYADDFNSSPGVTTYAYPTTITDPAGNSSTVKYRYDIGANVEATSPAPAGQTYGKKSKRLFDSIGRLDRQSVYVNTTEKAYTRYEYPSNGIQAKTFTTVIDVSGSTSGPDTADEVLSESWTDGAGRVRGSRTEHPGSTGGWTATQTEYNVLGQVYRTSVPTEVSVSSPYDPSTWTAAGDDSTRGWIWNKAYYDWKGRTIRTVPSDSTGSDGKDTLISYAGCGCAGGMETTIEGPSVPRDDTSGNARRKQKVYADILGRNFKTEVYQWDGSTVYTTTVNTFNGRDQITNTRQYAGTTSASVYQDVVMTYDGHARMKTRHYPIEDSGEATTWNYNLDDSINQIIDPRDAITDFTYNSRGLTTEVAYTPVTDVPDTPTVTYTYDNLGNRTAVDVAGLTDTEYTYDSLSRLTKESVSFDALGSTNFDLDYTYNLTGGLASITDPFGYTVNYTQDKIGRLSSVTGAALAQHSNGAFVDNIKYRAFGSTKQIDYQLPSSETAVIKMGYNDGLKVSSFEATEPGSTVDFVSKADFTYFADGRASAKDDDLSDAFDRTFKYDFAGRISFNQFGIDPVSSKRVYEQSVHYDSFSNLMDRGTTYWDEQNNMDAEYENGRLTSDPSVIYDAAGNIVSKGASATLRIDVFDAAGRKLSTKDRWVSTGGQGSVVNERKNEHLRDADGRPVVELLGSRQVSPTPGTLTMVVYQYQVWSSVLGQAVATMDSAGSQVHNRIYMGGTLLATAWGTSTTGTSADDAITFHATDPVTDTEVNYGYTPSTSFGGGQEKEPFGQKIASVDPYSGGGTSYGNILNSAQDPEWQCMLPKEFYGGFFGLPAHCQRAEMQGAGFSLQEAFGYGKADLTSIAQTASHEGSHGSAPTRAGEAASDVIAATTAKSTDKTSKEESDGNCQRGPSGQFLEGCQNDPDNPTEIDPIGKVSAEFGSRQTNESAPYSLKDLVKAAETKIRSATGKCADLLGKNALAAFDRISKNIVYDDKAKGLGGAITDGENIYLNPWSYVFSEEARKIIPVTKGSNNYLKDRNKEIQGYLDVIKDKGITNYDYAVAGVIHEFLHAIKVFPSDVRKSEFADGRITVDAQQSKKNQEKVIETCFKEQKNK